MTLLRSYPRLCFALVLLALLGHASSRGDLSAALVPVAIAFVSWFITEGPRGRTAPRWLVNVAVLGVVGSVLWDYLSPPRDLPVLLGRFTSWLLLVKLFDRRSARDHGQLVSLAMLLLLVGCLEVPPRLLFGAILMVSLLLALHVVLLHRLYAAHERISRQRREVLVPGEATPLTVRPASGRNPAGNLRLAVSAIALLGLSASIAIFVSFPRGLGRPGAFGEVGFEPTGARTGYAEEVHLLSGTRITTSRRPVFELRLLDGAGSSVDLDGPLLLRGAVLEVYERGQWRALSAPTRRVLLSARSEVRLAGRDREPARVVRQELRFESPVERMFSLGTPEVISADGDCELVVEPTVQTVRVAPESPRVWSYEMTSRLDATDEEIGTFIGLGPPPLYPIQGWRNPRDPATQAMRAVALEILGAAGAPPPPPGPPDWAWNRRAGEAFAAHLRSDLFRYTLDLGDVVPGDVDPILHFLTVSRRGHCEYYASALVALCHSVGVDARLVTGFLVTERDEVRDVWPVTEAAAHAWAEVRTGRWSHTTVDPTPAAALRRVPRDDPSFAQRIEWFYRRVEGAWSNGFVAFDERTQARMLRTIDESGVRRIAALMDDVREWLAGVNRAFYFGSAGYIWLGIVGAIGLAFLLVLAERWRRTKRRRRILRLDLMPRRRARRMADDLGFYAEMLAVLRRADAAKPDWRPPLAHASALAERDADAAAIVRELAALYYAARFGHRRIDAPMRAAASARVGELRLRLRKGR